MNRISRKASIATLGILATILWVAPLATPVFAWHPCGLTLSPSTQVTTIPAGTTVTLTYLLTYSESPAYASYFTLSVHSSNSAWTIGTYTTRVPSSGTSDSISQIVSVEVTAPSTPGSTTTITVSAANYYDRSAGCSAETPLTAGAFPPTVPQFPLGMVLLMAVSFPAMLLIKKKSSISSP
ncbi:MAG: hypothetical protein ABSB26_10100 [Nitrososphaerales archaeon]|jgi:hypothetical protein